MAEVLKKIEMMKGTLEELMIKKRSLIDKEIVNVSQELDRLLNIYYKYKS